jgi:hypothetical protein
MMVNSESEPAHASLSVGALLRANGVAMLVAAGLTVAVHLGTFLAAGALSPPWRTLLTLLAGLLWVVLAAPIFAAGSKRPLDSLLRAGAVVDSGIVVLAVLVLGGQGTLTASGAAMVWLLWAAVALAECGLVLLSSDARRRHALAVAAALLVVMLTAGPFWANAAILSADVSRRGQAAWVVAAVNPVLATARCLPEGSTFVWPERKILYEYTVLGRDVPLESAPWHVTFLVYAVPAAVLLIVACLRRRQRRMA